MKIDLGKALEKANSYEVLEPGEYQAKIFEYSLQMSKTGKPMVKWIFELENKRRFYNYTLLDNEIGLGIFAQTVDNGGYNGDMSDFDIEDFCSKDEIVGGSLIVVLGVQPSETHDGDENYVKYTKKIKEEK